MLALHGLVLSVVEKAETFFKGLCQVGHKEMKEMRLNHCRGVVTNLVDTQNRRDLRPEGTSHVNVNLYCCHDRYPAQRWHDLMPGSITEQGKLAESV